MASPSPLSAKAAHSADANTAWRPLDPMGGMMGSRYGSRRPTPVPAIPPPPLVAAPAPRFASADAVILNPPPPPLATADPKAKAVERARRVRPSVSGKRVKMDVLNPETIRGRVMLVLGWMSHDLRDKPVPRVVTPRNDEDLPEIHREDIVVRCWQVYGAPFAMHRHDHPNSNSVQSKLSDLTALGLVCARTMNTLSLTTRGWWWWRKALAVYGGSVSDPTASGLFEREAPAVSSDESSGAR